MSKLNNTQHEREQVGDKAGIDTLEKGTDNYM